MGRGYVFGLSPLHVRKSMSEHFNGHSCGGAIQWRWTRFVTEDSCGRAPQWNGRTLADMTVVAIDQAHTHDPILLKTREIRLIRTLWTSSFRE